MGHMARENRGAIGFNMSLAMAQLFPPLSKSAGRRAREKEDLGKVRM